ncbi:unnamed protein product [Owenia fusiformis]|uniref:Beta-1,4-mannosyl-glycoprotein beta-1,4-N-acetylglucosaminyltransferase n=1 Tax=Owenia fusiformis TaxID=6347 RepID=A0A8S4NYY4_OWEFU|nr:unnamed protein product [Owenia fusiformis]
MRYFRKILVLTISACLLVYIIKRKFWIQILTRTGFKHPKTALTHRSSQNVRNRTSQLEDGRIFQDFLNRNIQLQDSKNVYFDTVGGVVCYIHGTIRRQLNSCICRDELTGEDCGIPLVVADAHTYSSLKSKLKRRLNPRRVLMAITFNHEFDMLEARLYEHYEHVDVFLIVESNYSSHGDPKPLRLLERLKKGYLAEYVPKLMYIFLDTFPSSGRKDGWAAETYIKNAASILGLPRLNQTRPDDLYLFSDADELVSKEIVIFLKLYEGYPEPMSFSLRWSTYTFYWKNKDNTVVTSACSLNMLKRLLDAKSNNIRGAAKELSSSKNLNNVMRYRKLYGDVDIWVLGSTMHPAGWHCSWCSSPEDILVKLTSAINADFPRWGDYPEKRNLTYISNLIKTGTWFNGERLPTPTTLATEKNRSFAPAFFLDHFDTYKNLLRYDKEKQQELKIKANDLTHA